MAKTYTNREELLIDDPENTVYMPDADKPVGQADSPNPVYPPGATDITTGSTAGPEGEGPQAARPELGMNPQGAWTPEKAKAMFPGMFQDTEQWLDPAEEAKRREGMPYDPSKKYDEKKIYPGINGPNVPGAGGPDNRPPILKADRKGFEETVFAKIGGNPFLINPYDEVVKADKGLPELFNHVFQGRAVWSDIGKLDKDERAYWEQMKKEYHERTYKAALGKKQGMEKAYKWMMGQFDYDQKQAAAELSRQDKLQARKEAAAGKTPTFREIYNSDGVKTLHLWNSETRDWDDTGKRTGQYTLEDMMPPNIRFIAGQLSKLEEGLPPQLEGVIGAMKNGPEKDRLIEQFSKKLTPEQKERKAKLEPIFNAWAAEMASKGWAPKASTTPGAPTAGGKVEKPAAPSSAAKDMALIINAKKQNHPNLKRAIEAFRIKYPDAATQQRLDAALSKLPGSHYTPGAGEAY